MAYRHLGHNSRPLESIQHSYQLTECLVDCAGEVDWFRNYETDEDAGEQLAASDQKLAALTRWLLACFEARPHIKSIYVPSRDATLVRLNGAISIRQGNQVFDLPFVPMPVDGEDRLEHPVFVGAGAVVDAPWMDDDLERVA